MPAGAKRTKLPSTSSGMLTRSGEKHHHLERQREVTRALVIKSSPDEFTPEIHDQDKRGEYRFQCPSAGLFQCSITGLVFRMEGEGEVLYRTVPWDRRLLAQNGKRPAGPLFKFTCLKGSVCQLHLPHCEIHSEGGCDFLSVAHVTDDDSMEFLHHHETRETHVILNITQFSKYGITKDKEAPVSPIRALVLLFYQLPDDNNKSTLNVLLLPRNVDIDEVCKTRRTRNGDREMYIEKNPNCRLTPDQEYTLSTDLTDEHHIDPKKAEFVDYDSYTNYMPTFQLCLKTVVEEVNLLLKEGPKNEIIWDRLVSLPVTPPGGARAESKLHEPAAPLMDVSIHPPQQTSTLPPTSMKPVAASEREQKPAGARRAKLTGTSSRMLTRSGEKRHHLERQGKGPRSLDIRRSSMLMNEHDLAKKLQRDHRGKKRKKITQPAGDTAGTTTNVSYLLLGALAELVSEELELFQWHLIHSVEGFPSIPRGQLEYATRLVTVDRMVQQYHEDGAVEITLEILRKMDQNNLADELEKKFPNNV
ncbi:NACHT, LRR and PYD domains-containing protein 1b allele 3 [Salmo trutta]|uniref:NACHT, LRR and PYD domains-containing protein 1b allele 3 n=1 Tax=Salmo trutta TaxID=8032 RepID=UPI001132733D|nr:NACHT, LRR and PYD domains-containing protein 1b allele 3-like [Salmo trutta]